MANFIIQKGEFSRWIWKNKNTSKTHINIIMENIENKNNFNNNQLEQIRRKVSCTFISQYHRYWKIARRTQSKFEKKKQTFYEKYLRNRI